MAYRLTRTARDQVNEVLRVSHRRHGNEAAQRYAMLIVTAIARVGDQPLLPASIAAMPALGIRTYAIRLSRTGMKASDRVGSPRHLLVYSVADDGDAIIMGLIHDRMLLSRAARRLIRHDT